MINRKKRRGVTLGSNLKHKRQTEVFIPICMSLENENIVLGSCTFSFSLGGCSVGIESILKTWAHCVNLLSFNESTTSQPCKVMQ